MKAVLILHGIFGYAGENWLHDELQKQDYDIMMPTLPNPNHPDRAEWLTAIRQHSGGDTNNLIIVAHSLGAVSALDFIEQSETPVKALISVAGFADDYGAELKLLYERKGDNVAKVNQWL